MSREMTKRRIVGVWADPWKRYADSGGLYGKWMRFVMTRAISRDREYMERLFEQAHPGQEFIALEGSTTDLGPRIRERDTVVILFSDAVGQGMSGIERYVMRHRERGQEIRVLNGRRREFVLTGRVWRQLKFRRFLERVPLVDVTLVAVLVLLAPVLLLADAVTGRKDVYK